MSYEPTNWKSGDTVTSAKLNKMEQGIANAGVVVCTMDMQTMALDHTYAEITAGYAVFADTSSSFVNLAPMAGYNDQSFSVMFLMGEEQLVFTADSADGYPVAQM